MLAVFQRNIWARVGVLVIVLVAALWAAGGPSDRKWIETAVSVVLAVLAPAAVVGASWAWLKLDVRSGMRVAAITLVVTVGLIGAIVGRGVSDWFIPKQASQSSSSDFEYYPSRR